MRTLVLGERSPGALHARPAQAADRAGAVAGRPGLARRARAQGAARRDGAAPQAARAARSPRSSSRPTCGSTSAAIGSRGELAREVGDDRRRLARALAEGARHRAARSIRCSSSEHAFPGVGFFERREVAKLAETATEAADAWWRDAETDPHAALWRHLAAIALRHPAPPPLAIARALDAWRAGPPSLRGDGDAIRELLVEKLTTAGGEVRAGKVAEANVSWGKIASLTLANGDELGCGQVVASSRRPSSPRCSARRRRSGSTELAEGIVDRRLSLHAQHRPRRGRHPRAHGADGRGDRRARQDPVGDAAFSIHLGETDDAGRVVATIAARAAERRPDRGRAPRRRSCIALRAGLWKRLGDVMPFFEKHLVLAHSPFEATPPQVPGGRGSYDVPRNLPLAMPPVWTAASSRRPADTGALGYVDRAQEPDAHRRPGAAGARHRGRARGGLERGEGRVRARRQEEGLPPRRSRRRRRLIDAAEGRAASAARSLAATMIAGSATRRTHHRHRAACAGLEDHLRGRRRARGRRGSRRRPGRGSAPRARRATHRPQRRSRTARAARPYPARRRASRSPAAARRARAGSPARGARANRDGSRRRARRARPRPSASSQLRSSTRAMSIGAAPPPARWAPYKRTSAGCSSGGRSRRTTS